MKSIIPIHADILKCPDLDERVITAFLPPPSKIPKAKQLPNLVNLLSFFLPILSLRVYLNFLTFGYSPSGID